MTHQFFNCMAELIYCGNDIVSVCDACAIVHVTDEVPSSRSHSSSGLPRVPGFPSGTQVINYPGNKLPG